MGKSQKLVPRGVWYTNVARRSKTFLRVLSMTPKQSHQIQSGSLSFVEKQILDGYNRPGCNFRLILEAMRLTLLLYNPSSR
ncbi:hypothetical protein [Holospora curviuscula]|uniref:Uncharacterized protein n=1 Tax=Holospora curviuscula TaxID=1082868 RepID=A0A2S5RA43_9PROT|nr:hypothetical protein [Holospora curviuscula]PPE04199.1 hypothetical protein HCUR_00390 [Holospora curviuscula]